MGNRGTTPSWDDEQIAKYGLFAHLDMVYAPFRAEKARRNAKEVAKYIERVLALLPDQSEETRARASFTIPQTLIALSMGDTAILNWRKYQASDIYGDWFRRSGQHGPILPFNLLSVEEQTPFHHIIEAVIAVRNAETNTT